ncbi:hypothetical protein M0811_11520 [Anaeramoeba ignava]|uniref:Ubiquitin-like domain-containing protein n=1 Tax=Anaeramoeba ignava TaxID=1746090 RepID=A0A9Q0LBW7_ANAIG|nr:hypothetical protein M0811_11520 [Anaeramoeba ignava]
MEISIIIKTNNKQIYRLKVEKNIYVYKLKHKISEITGINESKQSLIYEGKELIDEKKIDFYGKLNKILKQDFVLKLKF